MTKAICSGQKQVVYGKNKLFTEKANCLNKRELFKKKAICSRQI
jgi:hypothetical protein